MYIYNKIYIVYTYIYICHCSFLSFVEKNQLKLKIDAYDLAV